MKCRIIKDYCRIDDSSSYLSYGLEIPTGCYHDLCLSYSKICAFAQICRKLNLSALHFSDAVSDFVNEELIYRD